MLREGAAAEGSLFPLTEVLAQGFAQTVTIGCIVVGDDRELGRLERWQYRTQVCWSSTAPPAIAPILHEAAINPAVLCSMIRKYSGSGIKGLPL